MNRPLPIIERAVSHGDAVAVQNDSATHRYHDLVARSAAAAAALLDSRADLNEARVAYRVPAGCDHIAAQWGIWRAGGIAVPLSLAAAEPELECVLQDSGAECVVATREFVPGVQPLCERRSLRLVVADDVRTTTRRSLPDIDPGRRAMMLYTSGTTSRPKGVVTTHECIQAQIESLVTAWRWEPGDRIPLFLPLHHIHGIINVMSCALWAGAEIEPFRRFEAEPILERAARGAWTVFMAVPTIYIRLIEALERLPAKERAVIVAGFQNMRLMVSGSAALPASVHQQWSALTGQTLLERYGMTEIGMALSNPYDGERRPGAVGQPLPGVEIRLRSDQGHVVDGDDEPGEIQVRGPNVFLEYWNSPEATRESFQDGWFCTGDVAVRERGYYRILGRQSVDIIKSGGYKLSALEIEAALLDHPAIRECAVVGLADAVWGETVAAAVVLRDGWSLEFESLQGWCRERLSPYKIPKRMLRVEQLPRNALGKVTKPAVRALFEGGTTGGSARPAGSVDGKSSLT